jgi:hypothetical protein
MSVKNEFLFASEKIPEGIKVHILLNGVSLTFYEVLQLWSSNEFFRDHWIIQVRHLVCILFLNIFDNSLVL